LSDGDRFPEQPKTVLLLFLLSLVSPISPTPDDRMSYEESRLVRKLASNPVLCHGGEVVLNGVEVAGMYKSRIIG